MSESFALLIYIAGTVLICILLLKLYSKHEEVKSMERVRASGILDDLFPLPDAKIQGDEPVIVDAEQLDLFPLPDAKIQGDEPVIVDAEQLGKRDINGRFEKIPNLGEVLKASKYRRGK